MNRIYAFLFLFPLFKGALAQNYTMISAFEKSIERERNKDYLGAIKVINELKDTLSYEVILRLGWLHYRAGFKKKSVSYYQKAISLMPGAIEPRLGFGFPAYELENFSELIAEDKKILAIDPNNKTVNSNLGHIYYYDKQYRNALAHFQKIAELYPFDYDNNLILGWTYLRLKQNNDALRHFKITYCFSPADASVAEGLESMGQAPAFDDKVVNAFAKSIELSAKSDNTGAIRVMKELDDQNSYFVNLRLGWLYYLSGAYNESVSHYKIACGLKPGAIEPRLGIAFPLEAMGNKDELKAQYESILTIDPRNTFVLYKLGMLFYDKKDYATAFQNFKQVVSLYPFDYDGLLMFAWSNFNMGRVAESRDLFSKVLCLAPGDTSAKRGLTAKAPAEQKTPSGPR